MRYVTTGLQLLLSFVKNKSRVKSAFLRLFFKRAEQLPGTGKGIKKVSEADLKPTFYPFRYLKYRLGLYDRSVRVYDLECRWFSGSPKNQS